MTREISELREKAVCSQFIDNDLNASIQAQMQLVKSMKYMWFFRYRTLTYYEIDSLKDETLYLRWPSTYEDIGDCTPVLDLSELTDYIIEKKFSGYDIDELKKRYVSFQEIIDDSRMIRKANEIRDMWLVSCFTEKYDNDDMWDEYADERRGICLAYEAGKLLKEIQKYNILDAKFMPVRYVDNRQECKDMMMNHHDLLEDSGDCENKLLLACMTKDYHDYSKEEEWRLLMFGERKGNQDNGVSAPFINPDVIICGSNIDTNCEEYKKMIELAEQKNIKVISAF